jgi:hypothetical protein
VLWRSSSSTVVNQAVVLLTTKKCGLVIRILNVSVAVSISVVVGRVIVVTRLHYVFQAHRHDQNMLQRRLVESHDTCRLLQTRLEELVGFLQELLTVMPPVPDGNDLWRSHLSARLNETQSLLSDVSMSLAEHGQFQ